MYNFLHICLKRLNALIFLKNFNFFFATYDECPQKISPQSAQPLNGYIYKYIYILCLFVWVCVCSVVSYKRFKNGSTDRTHDPREGLWILDAQITKKIVSKSFWSLWILENAQKNIIKLANFFLILFYIVRKRRCSQIEPQLKV